MLLGRQERSMRFPAPLLAIFIVTAILIYEWHAFLSGPGSHVLPLNNYLPTQPSSGEPVAVEELVDPEIYRQVYSASTADKKYFFIDFIDQRSINPNIVPHPLLEDTWIIVAQRHDPESESPWSFAEITCNAVFQNGTLRCLESPSILPVETAYGDKCEGDLLILSVSDGPHDARVFYGPEAPYTIYGSGSTFTCFGQFVQDLGSLLGWEKNDTFPNTTGFKTATELQRPPPYGRMEKNWFVFWDRDGLLYCHYDVSPQRSFARLELDGSVGEDLAPRAALAGDDRCMAKYMPRVTPHAKESIHQATNSLSLTLCKRSDPSCEPSNLNTFVLAIFQTKRYRFFHSVYEPYAMLFEQEAPFRLHGISSKPFWIHGRWKPDGALEESVIEHGGVRNWNQTEMFYITSMSWRSHKQKYHGYIDDVVFLGFGIEDFQSAGIDVVVGDLLMDVGLC